MFPTKNNITYELTYISNEGDSQMNKFSFTVTKGMYLPQVILKAAYAFIKDAYIHIDETPDTWIIVTVKCRGGLKVTRENERISPYRR